MDLSNKKIAVFRLVDIAGSGSGVTDFHIREDLLRRICENRSITRIIIIHDNDEREYLAQTKAVEMFVFIYCKTAVFCKPRKEDFMNLLPQGIRRKENIVCIGDRQAAEETGADYITLEDFLS